MSEVDVARPRVISVCSSVGGMDLGFDRAGFKTVAFCEFDPWRRKVLAKHWPGVPIWPDLSTLDPAELPEADVLIGGTPCQDLSVAGKRAGLEGERSGLFWDYMRVRNERNIPWAVWENVAGALSSNHGLDFASVLGAFVGADVAVPSGGWGGAGVVTGPWGGAIYRLLDAQYFGVPQRRRRVFVVGHLGGPCPPKVLLELAGGAGNSATGGGARQAFTDPDGFGGGIAGTLDKQDGGADDNCAANGHLVIAHTLTYGGHPGSNAPGRHREDDFNLVICTGAPPHTYGAGEVDGVAGSMDGASCRVDPIRTDRRRTAACGDGVVAPVAEWIGRRLRPFVTDPTT